MRLKVSSTKDSQMRQAAKRGNKNGVTQQKTHTDKKGKSF